MCPGCGFLLAFVPEPLSGPPERRRDMLYVGLFTATLIAGIWLLS